jgi:hypothetical protein
MCPPQPRKYASTQAIVVPFSGINSGSSTAGEKSETTQIIDYVTAEDGGPKSWELLAEMVDT